MGLVNARYSYPVKAENAETVRMVAQYENYEVRFGALG